MEIKYAELIAPQKFAIRYGELKTGDNEVMMKIAACGLCKWEIENHYEGKLGTFPQRLGHEPVGAIVEVGKNVKGWKIGERVTGLLPGLLKPESEMSLEGFATYATANPHWLVKVPDNIELEYALGEPLKCISTIARAANHQFGDYVFLIGCGAMGLLVLATLKGNTAAEVIAVDLLPERLKLAEEMGATITLNSKECDVDKEIQRITKGHGIDVAIEATGNPKALQIASRVLGSRRPKLVIAGYHGSSTTCDMNAWCRRGVEIHVPHPNYSLDELEDMRRAIRALSKGIFPMEKIITHRFKLDEIQTAFETATSKPKEYIKGIVTP